MATSKSQTVLQLALANIRNSNTDGLTKVLNVMPLDKLGKQSNTLLAAFLSTCAKFDRKAAMRVILQAWRDVYPHEERVQFLSHLFMIREIDLPTLAWVVLNHPAYTYVELMDDLIMEDNSPEIVTACSKADQIFGSQPHDTYKIIMQHANEFENWRVAEYAIASMEEVAPFQKVPEWIKNYTDKDLVKESDMYVPETGDVQFQLPTNERAVELLTSGLNQLGISANDEQGAKQYLMGVLERSNEQEKRELLRPVIENQIQKQLGGDEWLFRVFGPANPLVDQDLTLPGKSNKYGGCRMFLCDVFDYDEDFDYVADWFTGACETCHLRIRQRWHAVRKPRPHGGWKGCFCSWKCTRESIFEDEQEPDLLTHELINLFEKQINETGIQDRLPDSKE